MTRINILGEAIQEMKLMKDNSIDFVLVDPPYEVTSNKKDIKIPFEPMWEQLLRITKESSTIAIFAQGLFYVDLINSNRKMFRYDRIWDKVLTSNFLNANWCPLRQHEQIAVFQKYPRKTIYNPQFTEGKPLHSKGKSYINKEHKNQNYGNFHMTDDSRAGSTQKYPTSIIRVQKPHPSKALHRTEKPVPLLEELIKTYTNEGDIVLDFAAGSFSTAEACIKTNRGYICIEKDEVEYNKGIKRINEL